MGATAAFQALSASTYSTAVKRDDGQCTITGDWSRLQNSHLVPEAEEPWVHCGLPFETVITHLAHKYVCQWSVRGMSGLTSNPQGIKSPPNCLAMRADLDGQGMDHGHFVFTPYAGKADCVCLTNGMPDFAADYHLRAVKIPTRINPMNTYARFAWGLFRAAPNLFRELAKRRDHCGANFLDNFRRYTPGKRPHTKSNRDEQKSNAAGGHNKQAQEDQASMLTDDDGSLQESSDETRPLAMYALTDRDLEAAEGLDADLATGRPLARYEEAVGIYPGFSKAMRLKQEYLQQHPEVSAVKDTRSLMCGRMMAMLIGDTIFAVCWAVGTDAVRWSWIELITSSPRLELQ
ncbi:hypothetical protein B0H17DRAFT_1141924 [Mycena rosella]|uniref:HNH nuclease domain-containing protein n=1 Tax=Mycena rosella TaxID=1033263 RepID=A0AAD7G5M8_MYCRO|nr:hypothetical protein B0H17DRAFT_1141924 [Mycena rosella]